MPNPTNPNEAEDAERENQRKIEFFELATEAKQFLLDHDIELPTDTTAGHMAIWCQGHMKAQKQKWVEQMDASFPTKHQLWVTAASIVNADSEDHEDDEIIEPVFKQLETIFAAWRAALRGETKHE